MSKIEKTVEQQLADAQQEIKELNANISALDAQRTAQAISDNEKLQHVLGDHTRLKQDLADAEALNQELQAELENTRSQVNGVVLPIVTNKKKKYRVLAPKIGSKEGIILASDLKNYPELIERMVAKNSDLLQLIEG